MINEELVTLSLPYSDMGNKTVRVFVPEHDEGESLPVVYMTDGQNLFEMSERQFGCWYTREAVRAERASSGKAAIIVGIHNDGHPAQRTNDLTPDGIAKLNPPVGIPEELARLYAPRGEVFGRFILDTVMPEVEKRFPVKKGRENTAFCGSSMGGLEALYLALTYPETFSASGVFSPAPVYILYEAESFNEWVRKCISGKDDLPYLYFYSGGGEPMEKEMMSCMEKLYGSVFADEYPADKLIKVVKPEMLHNEKAWEPIFRDFLHLFLMK